MSEVIQLKIDIRRISATDIERIATIPLIIVLVFLEWLAGCIGAILAGYTPSREAFELSLVVDVPLILIVVGVWLSRHRLFVYLGRIGTIIWLLPFGFYSAMVLGEFEHTDPIIWIEYPILLLSTISVTFSLWKRKKKEGEHEGNLR